MKRALRLTTLTLVLSTIVLVGTPAVATVIPITGTAGFTDSSTYKFDFSGTGNGHSVLASSATNDAFALICSLDKPCQLLLPAGDRWSIFFPGDSSGALDGAGADFVRSTLQVSFIAPDFGEEESYITVPATISGIVTGMRCHDLDFCQSRGPIWAVQIYGEGSLDLYGHRISDDADHIADAKFAFAGTATPVPEPSTLLLMGSGVMGLVGFLRRQN